MLPRRALLVDALTLLGIALLVLIGYKLSLPPQSIPVSTVPPEPGCDLHQGPCRATLPDGRQVELSIEPRPIPMMAPLKLSVRTTGSASQVIGIDFAGVDMDMGPNHTQLVAASNGLYQGQAILPLCVTGKMPWQATVSLVTPSGRISIPFRFEAQPR